MDALTFAIWLIGIICIGIPAVIIGIPCIFALIALWVDR